MTTIWRNVLVLARQWRQGRADKLEAREERKRKTLAASQIGTNSGYHNSPKYDAMIEEFCSLIESGALSAKAGEYTTKIGSLTVWTSNWPHAYGHPWDDELSQKLIPSPLVRLRLKEALEGRPGEDTARMCDAHLRKTYAKLLSTPPD